MTKPTQNDQEVHHIHHGSLCLWWTNFPWKVGVHRIINPATGEYTSISLDKTEIEWLAQNLHRLSSCSEKDPQ